MGNLAREIAHEGILTDIYLSNPKVEERIKKIGESDECRALIEKARKNGSSLSMLSQVVPPLKVHYMVKLRTAANPFYNRAEYRSKDAYLEYLRKIYGFLITALERPPPRSMRYFYPSDSKAWKPSKDLALKLLEEFYIEVKLIHELTEKQWKNISRADNPEVELTRMLYDLKFKPEFEEFLNKLPWFIAKDLYGGRSAKVDPWHLPGTKLPKRPKYARHDFIDTLVKESKESRAYMSIKNGGKTECLESKQQILDIIHSRGKAVIDAFAGLSKIESDYIIVRRITIWPNSNYRAGGRFDIKTKLGVGANYPYFYSIKEYAVPLEIPFLEPKMKEIKQ